MTRDLVSIVIPCHNQGRFLSEAISAAQNQSYAPCEVIVIDDGSTDETSDVARDAKDVRLVHQERQGVARARNNGLSVSSGRFIVFSDADDRLMPNAVEDGVNVLRRNPGCAFTYGHVRLISENGNLISTPPIPEPGPDQYLALLRRNYIWTSGAVVYRRPALEAANGFRSGIDASADYDLNVRLARMCELCRTNSIVLEYRRHETGMSRDYATMLASAVNARLLQKQFLSGEIEKTALKEGIRFTQSYYGEKLIDQMCELAVSRDWTRVVSSAMALLRYYPRGIAMRLLHKPFRLLSSADNR